MGRPRKNQVEAQQISTRDPIPTVRDPQIEKPKEPQKPDPKQEKKRVMYIAANMPTVCPLCQHNTRASSGRHIDPVNRKILEYRTCSHCFEKLAAVRKMTKTEEEKFCTHANAVKDYEKDTFAKPSV